MERLAGSVIEQNTETAMNGDNDLLQVSMRDRLTRQLGPWDCVSCPPGVIHGYVNASLEPVYFQVMLGRAKPDTMGYADDALFQRRDAHLIASR